jgi:hypothetical protein
VITGSEPTSVNYFDDLFDRLSAKGHPGDWARIEVFEAYLAVRPAARGKKKLTWKDRDELFWSSQVVRECPADQWQQEAMVLALTRYFGQQRLAAPAMIETIARQAPGTLVRAVRHSRLVLEPRNPRRAELDELAKSSGDVAELCRVLDIFDAAYLERVAEVDLRRAAFAELTPFELLACASLYAFAHLIPHGPTTPALFEVRGQSIQGAWDAINELLIWKLRSAAPASLRLDDRAISGSVRRIFSAALFPESPNAAAAHATLAAFGTLLGAQIELDEFMARSIDAFCHDDSIRFERRGNRLEIVEVDPASRARWSRDGRKLERLHGYWFYRATNAFAHSAFAHARIGRPENEVHNRLACIRALGTQLRLREVYGVGDRVVAESGESVDLFQALLSLELMSVFFLRDFLAEFAALTSKAGDWISGLRELALKGLRDGLQNRWPLTWSDRSAKIANITGWTVNDAQPQGSARMAAAILDFWTYDLVAIAERLQRGDPGLQPRLFERPVFRFGATLVQLPWVVGMQNNSTAAINNLRRLGSRRTDARAETQRIEARLADLLRGRGFRVVTNWNPPPEAKEAGEIDVIAARDGHLFVLEIKSTYVRQSQRDAWVHATSTLRRAGRQLGRKLAAVRSALEIDASLIEAIGGPAHDPLTDVHGWIVDTSIECDHQRFSGFLKFSLEEILIALRDDRHLLDDPVSQQSDGGPAQASQPRESLYPGGFTAARFIEVIEQELVWASA